MTNSHLLGFVTFGSFALFALLAWGVSYKHPDVARNPVTQRTTRRTAVFLFVLGMVLGYFAFAIDYRMRITTLHEEMVEGSVGMKAGTPAPIRTVTFQVEHPGVAHELFLSPNSELLQQPESDVEVAFSLHGPEGEAILPESTEKFSVSAGSRNDRADWEGKTFAFTPKVVGAHTVRVKPRAVGIPRIQVRIEDPMKRDGERPSGY